MVPKHKRKSPKIAHRSPGQTGSGPHPVSYPVDRGGGAFFSEIKRPDREADHPPPSSAEVKNAWSYTSTPIICIHGVVGN